MTCLSAMQSAAIRLVGRKPSTFFGTTNQFEAEIVDLLNDVARDICLSHDWQALTKIATISGNGVDTAFPLPDDYDRMVLAQSVGDSNNWFWNYTPVPDMDTWVGLQLGRFSVLTPGWWIILENQFQFYPAPATDAKYPYISNLYARSSSNSPQATFQKDDDTFVLDERLLTLALVWRWREQKHLDVTGDMAQFQKAFDEASARDRGSRVIRNNGRMRRPNLGLAWPWELG